MVATGRTSTHTPGLVGRLACGGYVRPIEGATAFTGAGIGCWDGSSAMDMCETDADATAFTTPIGDWNVSIVMDAAFTAPIGDWNVSIVMDASLHRSDRNSLMDAAFTAPIGGWNVSSVKNMPACSPAPQSQPAARRAVGTSTVRKDYTFRGGPGSIEGKTNDAQLPSRR